MTTLHVKKGDTVKILTGKNHGKEGVVKRAFPREGKVIVEGVNVVKKAIKGEGIVEREHPIHVSNVKKIESKKKETAPAKEKTKKPKANEDKR